MDPADCCNGIQPAIHATAASLAGSLHAPESYHAAGKSPQGYRRTSPVDVEQRAWLEVRGRLTRDNDDLRAVSASRSLFMYLTSPVQSSPAVE